MIPWTDRILSQRRNTKFDMDFFEQHYKSLNKQPISTINVVITCMKRH